MKGIKLAEELGNNCFLMEAYRKNVMLASYNGYNNTSNYFYSKIVPVAKKEHDTMTEAHVYNGVGYNSSSMDNYVAANDYYNKALEIYYEENGKPAMDSLYFNISHSENVAVCAVSDEPVGIDIEKIRDIKKNIVDRYFTCHEKKYLNNIEDSFRNAAFIRMWTIKESYVKYTGEGMKLGLDNFDIRISQDIQIYRDAELCKCHIKEYNLPDYKLTVCASENEFSDEVNIVVL